MATDYTTAGFLQAFKRFVGRRGLPKTMVSDCGTNLVGADAELRRLFNVASKESEKLANILANDGVKWLFNTPAGPHFGGKWEASVKSAKFHIKRVIGDTKLTYEEWCTLLAQIEGILNSRPLCPMTDDPSDVEALTPGHFVKRRPLNAVPEPSLADVPVSRLSRYQRLQGYYELIWKRWSTEYLQTFQEVSKWQHETPSIKEGALVLIADERYPPSKWPLARVVRTKPGQDKKTRVAVVRTATTELERLVVKLCPLPIDTSPAPEPGT